MELLRKYKRGICGVKYRMFAIMFDDKSSKYHYYVRGAWTDNIGDVLIYKSEKRSRFLNKFTLSIIGVFYSIFKYLIAYPFAVITAPFYMYIDGCRNFIRNSAWQNNVRFFNWVNIIMVILLLLWIILS